MPLNALAEKAAVIRCVVFDLDGVLTDGAIYLDEHGTQQRRYHVHDGIGIKLLQAAGINVAVITTTPLKKIEIRLNQLGITHYYCGNKDKLGDYQALKQSLNLEDEHIAYMGDDFPDLPLLEQVGLPATVANGTSEVKALAKFVSQQPGGQGAVREFCDVILHAQKKKEFAINRYLSS